MNILPAIAPPIEPAAIWQRAYSSVKAHDRETPRPLPSYVDGLQHLVWSRSKPVVLWSSTRFPLRPQKPDICALAVIGRRLAMRNEGRLLGNRDPPQACAGVNRNWPAAFFISLPASLDGEQPLPLRGRRLCFRARTQFVEHLANETAVVGLDVFQRPILEICLLDAALNLDRQCEPIIGRALGLGECNMRSDQARGAAFHPFTQWPTGTI